MCVFFKCESTRRFWDLCFCSIDSHKASTATKSNRETAAENGCRFEGSTSLVSILDLQSEAHISEKKQTTTLSSGISLPRRRDAASILLLTKTQDPGSCSDTTLNLASWMFGIRLVSHRGRMTSVAGCQEHVCHPCTFKNTTTGDGIYIFVTMYQRSILSLGVYNFFLNKMLMLCDFFLSGLFCFSTLLKVLEAHNGKDLHKLKTLQAVPLLSKCLFHCQLLEKQQH